MAHDTPARDVRPSPTVPDVRVVVDDRLPVVAKPARIEGRTRIGRIARRLTGGPGTPIFEAAVSVREVGLRLRARAVGWRGRLHRLPRGERTGLAPVRAAGYPVWARVVPRATPLSEHHRLVAAIGSALAAADVDRFMVPGPMNSFAVGVSAKQRQQTYAALRELGGSEDLLVSPVDPNRPLLLSYRPVPPEGFGPQVEAVSVWSPVVAADRTSLLGPHSRVTIEFWEYRKGGVLRAPTENRYTAYLLPESTGEKVAVRVGDTHQPTYPEFAETHVDDITFPIDLVYTWVDGSDPAWRARMLRARARVDAGVHESSFDASRFRSLDELKYSLRSAFAFVPWFRQIFLVTDHQVPTWLDTNDPRITVVSHEEIWDDPTQLPVFNSHAIESRLHHIPGLAEHYVYVNDDVFFGRMIPPQTFFTSGGISRFFPSPTRIGLGDRVLGEPPGSTAAKNDRRILREALGVIQTQRLKHTAHPQRRSVALELADEFGEVYRTTSGSAIRSPADISPIALQTWYGYRTGRAVPGGAKYAYVSVSRSDQLDRLEELRGGDFTMFCLNQSEEQTVDREQMTATLTAFLQQYFPFESPLER